MNESLDSRQLKAFVVLAQTGSYTETARQLFVTHSAISHSMRALEAQVGCRLLSSVNKKAMLTEAGEALLPYAHRVLAEMRQARRTLRELNRWGSRRLRLAVDPLFQSGFLTPVLVQFHREFPRVRLHVETCGVVTAARQLEHNLTDLVLSEQTAEGGNTEFIPLLADRFSLVVHGSHPLTLSKNSVATKVGEYPCFLLRHSSWRARQLDDFLVRWKINLNLAGEIEDWTTLKAMVQQTHCLALLPEWSIAQELQCRTLVGLSLGRKLPMQNWGMLHARSRPLSHAEAGLLKLCRKRVAELFKNPTFPVKNPRSHVSPIEE